MKPLLIAALLFAAPFAHARFAAAQVQSVTIETPQATSAGYVLLANGQVLRGNVTPEGEHALVSLGAGSQMRLDRGQIACVAPTLDGLFGAQHRRLSQNDVAGRIDLAHWCQRQGLGTAAGKLLVELVQLAPDDLRVQTLEQQMRGSAQRTSAVPSDPSSLKLPQADELHDIAEQVSPAAFESYMRHIQPLLVNRCAATGCHGVASKSEFQLLRPLIGAKLSQRMTQRNLHAVLGQVDRTSPLSSRLLQAATQPHAKLAAPLLHEQTDRGEIAALKSWLLALGAAKPIAPQATGVEQASPPVLLQPKSQPTTRLPPLSVPAAQRATAPAAAPAVSPREATTADDFNRQFHPDRFAPSALPAPDSQR